MIEPTFELILTVCLPLMGYNEHQYNIKFDTERPNMRELAYRILLNLDPKRACNNLTKLEYAVASFVDLESSKLNPNNNFAIHDHLL